MQARAVGVGFALGADRTPLTWPAQVSRRTRPSWWCGRTVRRSGAECASCVRTWPRTNRSG